MRTGRTSPFFAVALVVLGALALDGCSGGLGTFGPSGNSISFVRSIDALQGCPTNVDFEQLNVMPVTFSNVAYAVAPANYTSVRSGQGLHYGVFNTGQTSPAIALADINLDGHDSSSTNNTGTFTLVAAGVCGGGSGDTTPQLLRLRDLYPYDFSGRTCRTAGLRVIDLVPDLTGPITLASNGSALHGTDDPGTNNVEYAATSGFDSTHYNSGSTSPAIRSSPFVTTQTP